MSDDRSSGGGFFVAGVVALGFLGFAVAGGSSQPEKCDKPAPQTCYDVATTLVPPPDTVPGTDATPPPSVNPTADSSVFAPSSTAMPVVDSSATPRPNSEAAPKPTEAPLQDTPPPTEPPTTQPPDTQAPTTAAPRPSRTDRCSDKTHTVKSGEGWEVIARKHGVSPRELALANGTTLDGPLWVSDQLCLPKREGSDTTTTTTTTAPPATQAPQAPPTQAPTTTEQRRSPGGQRTTTTSTIEPVWVAPTTSAPKQPQAPPKQPQQPPSQGTVRPGPGTVRTTAPPCPSC